MRHRPLAQRADLPERDEARSGVATVLEPAGFFLLRTPLLPQGVFFGMADGLDDSTRAPLDGDTAEAALREARSTLRRRLATIVEAPHVREAIAVASPTLAARIPAFCSGEADDDPKLEQALMRYVARMAARATPFGLFASFAIGHVGEGLRLEVGALETARKHIRLDMSFLLSLADALARDPLLRDVLPLRPNDAMCELSGRFRYPELVGDGALRRYDLAAAPANETLRTILARCEGGATKGELARALTCEDVSLEQASSFIETLIDAQFLRADLRPALTGEGPLESLIATLRDVPSPRAAEVAGVLEEVGRCLGRAATSPFGSAEGPYASAPSLLASLPLPPDAAAFQVDMSRDAVATLGPRELSHITTGVGALWLLAEDVEPLSEFVDAFVARYGEREVPLLLALDEDLGIGHTIPGGESRAPAPLLVALGFEPSPSRSQAASMDRSGARGAKLSPKDRMLLAKLERAWQMRSDVITLTDDDLTGLSAPRKRPLPRSLAALLSVVRDGRGDDPRLYLHGWTAAAGRLLGRFSAWSEMLERALRDHVAQEDAGEADESGDRDVVFAEVVHLPDRARSANVIVRPVLREYEIAFGARSGASPDRVIPLADLMVSVVSGRVVLRSKKLGRRVIPRLSSAHNTVSRSITAYRFLALLPHQGVTAAAAFDWGPFASARELPRVEMGSVILSPFTWNLDAQEITSLSAKAPLARARAMAELRLQRRLPRYVALQDGDNVLPTDLDNALSVDALVGATGGRTGARLVEVLDHGEAPCTGDDGRYASELVIPLLRSRSTLATRASGVRAAPIAPRVARSDAGWLSVGLDCAQGDLDATIVATVAPILQAMTERRVIDCASLDCRDVAPTLRLSLRASDGQTPHHVLRDLAEAIGPLAADSAVRSLSVFPYEPPSAAFGSDAIGVVERLFAADTEAAVAVLCVVNESADETARWRYALAGMSRLLTDFGLEGDRRVEVAEAAMASLKVDLGVGPPRERVIAQRYRDERATVTALLDGLALPREIAAAFSRRSARFAVEVRQLGTLSARGDVAPRGRFVRHLVRAWNKRILRVNVAAHELVFYTFIAKHEAALRARRAAS